MATTYPIAIELDENTMSRFQRLVESEGRSLHGLLKQALERYLEEQEVEDRAREETLERWQRYLKTGEHIDNETVDTWLASWGSDGETRCPVAGA
jgi:predicted transcriptional regulator